MESDSSAHCAGRESQGSTEIGAHRVPSTEIGRKMNTRVLLATATATLGIAFAASLTQINMLNEQLAEQPVITKTVVAPAEQVRTPYPVEVIREVPVEVIKYVPQVQTETVYVEVPVVEQVTSTETVYETITEQVYLNELPACEFDEVTDVNCIWDASTQGNGEGTSFIAYNGNAYYLN